MIDADMLAAAAAEAAWRQAECAGWCRTGPQARAYERAAKASLNAAIEAARQGATSEGWRAVSDARKAAEYAAQCAATREGWEAEDASRATFRAKPGKRRRRH